MDNPNDLTMHAQSPEFTPKGPGYRLITYNLLNSALSCAREKQPRVDLIQIEDLCTLIDLFCLYDGVVLLGHRWSWDAPELAKRNVLAATLASANFIQEIDYSNINDQNFIRAHAKHLAAFLGQDMDSFKEGLPTVGDGLAEDYVEFSMGHHNYGNLAVPEDLMPHLHEKSKKAISRWEKHVELGGMPDLWPETIFWARTTPDRAAMVKALAIEASQNQRMHKFIMRTFVYVAFADAQRLPFTPDTARHPIVERLAAEENQFRGQLKTVLKQVFARTTPGDKDLLRRIPPLAAIIFQRARTARNIASELVKLHRELASLRATIRDIETQMLYAPRDQALRAAQKWEGAVHEVERNFGLEPRLVTSKAALRLGDRLGDVVDNPTSFMSWTGAITELPVEVIKRLVSRRTFIELHRLRPELPACEGIRNDLRRLFDINNR